MRISHVLGILRCNAYGRQFLVDELQNFGLELHGVHMFMHLWACASAP
jgi:hypothetical protein